MTVPRRPIAPADPMREPLRSHPVGVVRLVCVVLLAWVASACGAPTVEDEDQDEDRDAIEAIGLVRAQAERIERSSGGVVRRAMFTKHHGCVRGTLTPAQERPPEARYGVFASDTPLDAWLRLSNAAPKIRPDDEGNGRGLAIKVRLPGDAGERDAVQDFLMLNHPVFIVKDLASHNALLADSRSFLAEHPRTQATIDAIRARTTHDPLETRYWSVTAYALGPRVVKLSAAPCQTAAEPALASAGPDHLADALERHLRERPGCLRLMVQFQTDPERMPIEDPTVEWDESRSPFVTVATISIPPQSFRSPEQDAWCESLGFSPWNALPEHLPLGALNRARKLLYEAMAKRRGASQGG